MPCASCWRKQGADACVMGASPPASRLFWRNLGTMEQRDTMRFDRRSANSRCEMASNGLPLTPPTCRLRRQEGLAKGGECICNPADVGCTRYSR